MGGLEKCILLGQMIRLAFLALSIFFLLAATFLLIQSDSFPEKLPVLAVDWVSAFFQLFQNPMVTGAFLTLCLFFAVAAFFVNGFLFGLIFSILSVGLSLAFFLGLLGNHYPPLVIVIEHLFQ